MNNNIIEQTYERLTEILEYYSYDKLTTDPEDMYEEIAEYVLEEEN